ncbi:MAG: substrate-binding domain-containing protein [Lachnospiraceae bacterium]|nr:substrate-binding domain-containing protein [Lachnospiraceae bacterium]
MKKMRRILAVLMILVLAVGMLAGCSKGADTTPETTTKAPETTTKAPETTTEKEAESETELDYSKLHFGMSSKNMANPFQREVVVGCENKCKELGINLTVTDAGSDPVKQAKDMEDMIQAGCQAILFVPYDSSGLEAVLKQAHEAGVILINLDNRVDDSSAQYVDSIIVSDNHQAGQIPAEALVEALDGKGQIAIYSVPTSLASVYRIEGFKSVIEQYPDIEVVVEQTATAGSEDVALPVWETVFNTYPDLDGLFGYCDSAAQAAVSAAKSRGILDQVKIVSVDGSTDGKQFIRDGEMYGSAAQFPQVISESGVEFACTLLAGGTVEKEVLIPTVWCNKDNVDEINNFSE